MRTKYIQISRNVSRETFLSGVSTRKSVDSLVSNGLKPNKLHINCISFENSSVLLFFCGNCLESQNESCYNDTRMTERDCNAILFNEFAESRAGSFIKRFAPAGCCFWESGCCIGENNRGCKSKRRCGKNHILCESVRRSEGRGSADAFVRL